MATVAHCTTGQCPYTSKVLVVVGTVQKINSEIYNFRYEFNDE